MGIKQNRAMKHFGFARLLLGYITPARPKRPCQVIKTVVQIKSAKLSKQGLTSMPSRSPYPVQRRSSFSLGVWALILLGMLFGTMVSSMGGVTSHGLAAFAVSQQHVVMTLRLMRTATAMRRMTSSPPRQMRVLSMRTTVQTTATTSRMYRPMP